MRVLNSVETKSISGGFEMCAGRYLKVDYWRSVYMNMGSSGNAVTCGMEVCSQKYKFWMYKNSEKKVHGDIVGICTKNYYGYQQNMKKKFNPKLYDDVIV